jgi:hypothetical protein
MANKNCDGHEFGKLTPEELAKYNAKWAQLLGLHASLQLRIRKTLQQTADQKGLESGISNELGQDLLDVCNDYDVVTQLLTLQTLYENLLITTLENYVNNPAYKQEIINHCADARCFVCEKPTPFVPAFGDETPMSTMIN